MKQNKEKFVIKHTEAEIKRALLVFSRSLISQSINLVPEDTIVPKILLSIFIHNIAFVIFTLSYNSLLQSFLITTKSVIPLLSNVVNLCSQYSHSLLRLIAFQS